MNTTIQQLINEIGRKITILSIKIKDGINECKNYLECYKNEVIKRNELSNKKALDIIELLKKMTELFNGIVNNTNVEKEKLAIRNNELIDIIIDLERRKTNKLIDQNPKRKNGLNGRFKDIKEEWNEHKIKTKETPQIKVIVPNSKPSINNSDNNEMKQIEEWPSYNSQSDSDYHHSRSSRFFLEETLKEDWFLL